MEKCINVCGELILWNYLWSLTVAVCYWQLLQPPPQPAYNLGTLAARFYVL